MRCRRGEKGRWINQGNSREARRRSPRFWASISPPGNRDNPNKHSKKAITSTAGAGAGSSSTNTTPAMQKALPSSMHPHDQQLASTLRHIQEEKGHRGRTDESWLPEKRILGLVLDTLQRRDTYEIFAEPVDPSEVEEYYEIIKEPMDFGTMRAKLHEGMYKNLQQFEVLQSIYAVGNMGLSNWQEKHRPIATHASPHDVFLIFGNAMHFNSSATVYFRQARALEELAKKVFHALRTDPKNFELECAATRRRSSRGTSYGEFKDSNFGSCRKLERDLQSNDMNPNVRRRGYKRERRSCMTMSGIDRRSTYKPRTLLDEKFSALSPFHHGPTPLIHVNNGDQIGYKESLMLFVKDLGPTAQRVAKCKLQDCLQMQTPSNPPGSNEGSNSKPVPAVGFSRFRSCTLSNQRNVNNINIHGNLVGNFDLNQLQSVSSDSSPTTAGWFKNDDYMSNMVSSVPAPLPVPVPVPMPAGQFTFDLSYLKSRMRELNDADCLSYSHKMGSQGTIDAWYG